MLPLLPWDTRFPVLHFHDGRALTSCDRGPRRHFKPVHTIQGCGGPASRTKHGEVAPPSKWYTMRSATSGCLSLIIGNLSAQLAQQASHLVLSALLKPNPPLPSGRVVEARATDSAPVSTAKMLHKHSQSSWSCPRANSRNHSSLTTFNM